MWNWRHTDSEEFYQRVSVKNEARGTKGQDQLARFPLPPSPRQSQCSDLSGSSGQLVWHRIPLIAVRDAILASGNHISPQASIAGVTTKEGDPLLPRNNNISSNTHTGFLRSKKKSWTWQKTQTCHKPSGRVCSMSRLPEVHSHLCCWNCEHTHTKAKQFRVVRFDLARETKYPQEPKESFGQLGLYRQTCLIETLLAQATRFQAVFSGFICVGFLHVDITGEQPGHPQPRGLVPILEMCSSEPFPNI